MPCHLIENYMKGFYLIECMIAQLVVSFVLTAVLFITLKLYEDNVRIHYIILAKTIHLSFEQAQFMGVSYDVKDYMSSALPSATLQIGKSSIRLCWQTTVRECETL